MHRPKTARVDLPQMCFFLMWTIFAIFKTINLFSIIILLNNAINNFFEAISETMNAVLAVKDYEHSFG